MEQLRELPDGCLARMQVSVGLVLAKTPRKSVWWQGEEAIRSEERSKRSEGQEERDAREGGCQRDP